MGIESAPDHNVRQGPSATAIYAFGIAREDVSPLELARPVCYIAGQRPARAPLAI